LIIVIALLDGLFQVGKRYLQVARFDFQPGVVSVSGHEFGIQRKCLAVHFFGFVVSVCFPVDVAKVVPAGEEGGIRCYQAPKNRLCFGVALGFEVQEPEVVPGVDIRRIERYGFFNSYFRLSKTLIRAH